MTGTAHVSDMKMNWTPARRGFAVATLLIAVGVIASVTRIVSLNATADSLFFISLFATAAGLGVAARLISRRALNG